MTPFDLLTALETSAFTAEIKQSAWIYPAANTGHVLALMVFIAAVVIMDLRLLGFPAGSDPASVVHGARRAVIAALIVQVATGFMLFAPEATKLVGNPAFLAKLAFIGVGAANALTLGRLSTESFTQGGWIAPRLRAAALFSLVIWFTTAALGRLIAYA